MFPLRKKALQYGTPKPSNLAGLRVAPQAPDLGLRGFKVNPRKLEHGFRRISAGIPYALL